MQSRIKQLVKELGIKVIYSDIASNGFFGFKNNTAIIIINDNLDEIAASLTLLHEIAHFLNRDCERYISNHFQNDNIEFQANRYMIQEVMKLLDEKYEFTPDTNYQKIIDTLNLPYHLDGIIIDEFNNLISDKFGLIPYCESDYFYE